MDHPDICIQLLSAGVLFNPNTEPDLSDLEPIVEGFPWGTFPSVTLIRNNVHSVSSACDYANR